MERTDCWNQIGVMGDATCPELQSVVHCRNCPVYAAGGRHLLERESPAEYLREWTRVLAEEKEDADVAGTISVLIFRLGMEWLALTTQVCKEVAEMRRIHTLPHRSGRILLGLVNIRGEIQMCVSMRGLLGLEEADDPNQTMSQRAYKRLIVIERGREGWVFPVDEVYGIHRFHPDVLQDVPVTVAKAAATYTQGVIDCQEKHVGHLDDELVFSALKREVL